MEEKTIPEKTQTAFNTDMEDFINSDEALQFKVYIPEQDKDEEDEK